MHCQISATFPPNPFTAGLSSTSSSSTTQTNSPSNTNVPSPEELNLCILADESLIETHAETLKLLVQLRLKTRDDGVLEYSYIELTNNLGNKIQDQGIKENIAKIALESAKELEKTLGDKEAERKSTAFGFDSFNFGFKIPSVGEFNIHLSQIDQGEKNRTEASHIIYLAIASKFGSTEASYQLAKIYQENKYYFPLFDYSMDHDEMAIFYAIKAQEQGNPNALFDLGDLYDQAHSLSWFKISSQALKCYQSAAIYGHIGGALKAVMLLDETLAPGNATDFYSKQILESDNKKAKLHLGEWILTRNFIYDSPEETKTVDYILADVYSEDALVNHPKLKERFSKTADRNEVPLADLEHSTGEEESSSEEK